MKVEYKSDMFVGGLRKTTLNLSWYTTSQRKQETYTQGWNTDALLELFVVSSQSHLETCIAYKHTQWLFLQYRFLIL